MEGNSMVWLLTGQATCLWRLEVTSSSNTFYDLLRPEYNHLCLRFGYPLALAFDSGGNLFVADIGYEL